MIKYLFTRNDLIGSKLISGVTKRDYQKTSDTPSHFAILFNDRWVLHSNFANGVHIEPYYFFKKRNQVITSLRDTTCKMCAIECQLLFDQLTRKAYGLKYDWPAILYFAYRIILRWIFKLPIPDKNKWEAEDKWFCNEIFELVIGRDISMQTPNDLMMILLEHPNFDACEVFP